MQQSDTIWTGKITFKFWSIFSSIGVDIFGVLIRISSVFMFGGHTQQQQQNGANFMRPQTATTAAVGGELSSKEATNLCVRFSFSQLIT